MKQRAQPADIVDAYTQWAVSSIDAWATSASAMVDTTNRGSYTAADWFAEMGLWAGRMAEAGLDLYDTLVNGASASPVVTDDFSAGAPPRGFHGTRELRLAGPLHAQMTQATIGPAAVKIVPPTLGHADREFHLTVDPTNLPGDAYWGSVEVVVAGVVKKTVVVVVQVP